MTGCVDRKQEKISVVANGKEMMSSEVRGAMKSRGMIAIPKFRHRNIITERYKYFRGLVCYYRTVGDKKLDKYGTVFVLNPLSKYILLHCV